MYERVINLIGETNFEKLRNTKILLVGIGGVGSFAYEALIRSGFQNITVIDKDIIEITNLNRQLIANLKTISQAKVDEAIEKALNINKDIKIKGIKIFLDEKNINNLDTNYDYIIDACDTLKTKLSLIKFANNNGIKIICAMGLGNRIDASKVKITTLDKTNNDPLAKKLRKLVKENHLNLKTPVVCSTELPFKKQSVDSIITSPGVAGLLMVNYIINDIVKSN